MILAEQHAITHVDVVVAAPLGALTYEVPPGDRESIHIGMRVRVPLGQRHVWGYVIATHTETPSSDFTLKPLVEISNEISLPVHLLALVRFASDYYNVALGDMLQAALPLKAKEKTPRFLTVGDALAASCNERMTTLFNLLKDNKRGLTAAHLATRLGISRPSVAATLRTMQKNGLVQIHGTTRTKRRQTIAPLTAWGFTENTDKPKLTPEQAHATDAILASINEKTFSAFVLHGVTGSGKTEVYLRAVEQALLLNKSALVLVPEIALTPQFGARFRHRFGDPVAVIHSGLTPAERRDAWDRVSQGDVRIGLGARSAIFLPMEDLGVIIVDEEHETSFKQDETPRYHARDLAVYLAHRHGCPIVLGSATPSLESMANVSRGKYELLQLTKRVHQRPLPEVTCIDMTTTELDPDGVFTAPLLNAMQETIDRDEQCIILLNRRGFSPHVLCKGCGHTFTCTACSISLTFHKRRNMLLCHYCGFSTGVPQTCIKCESDRIEAFGLGTERVEAIVRERFPSVASIRLDRDTTRTRTSMEKRLQDFRDKKAHILIGTQMVAKGHDFPEVTLVGVLAADSGLHIPDFRATERTFQLLCQVAGRAGRGTLPGRVLLQTYNSDHYAIRAACAHDAPAFYAQEMQLREELRYPPFAHLVLVRFEGENEQETKQEAERMSSILRANVRMGEIMILGPAPAPIERLKGKWRVQTLLKASNRASLHKALQHMTVRPTAGVRWVVDIDPFNML